MTMLSMEPKQRIEIFIVTCDGGMNSLPLVSDDYLDALREFIDFVNQQVGVYLDALAGFSGNRTRIAFQTARVRQRFSRGKNIDGANVIVSSSLEDSSRPDVILNRISRAEDYIAHNSEAGFNEQQQARAIIVFMFAYWDEEIRPRLARAKQLSSPNEIRVDTLGDLRLLRRAIIHSGGRLTASLYSRLKVMQDLFTSDDEICMSHETMHQIFVRVKRDVGQLIVEHVGPRPGSPNVSNVKDVAIQKQV